MSYRRRLRLISGGVAAFARRSPVGASDTSSSVENNSLSVMPMVLSSGSRLLGLRRLCPYALIVPEHLPLTRVDRVIPAQFNR